VEPAGKPAGANSSSIFSYFEARISGLSKGKIRTTLIYLLPWMSDSAFKKNKEQQDQQQETKFIIRRDRAGYQTKDSHGKG
jgi:hypothetical protein